MVFKQENGGQYLSFIFFPCAQGLRKTSVPKKKKEEGKKKKKIKGQKAWITQSWTGGEPAHQRPQRRGETPVYQGLHLRSHPLARGRPAMARSFLRTHVGAREGNVSPQRESPQLGAEGASRVRSFSCERAALRCWRGKQKAELAFACCFSPALPGAIQEQVSQQLAQDTFPGMRPGSGRAARQAADKPCSPPLRKAPQLKD